MGQKNKKLRRPKMRKILVLVVVLGFIFSMSSGVALAQEEGYQPRTKLGSMVKERISGIQENIGGIQESIMSLLPIDISSLLDFDISSLFNRE